MGICFSYFERKNVYTLVVSINKIVVTLLIGFNYN